MGADQWPALGRGLLGPQRYRQGRRHQANHAVPQPKSRASWRSRLPPSLSGRSGVSSVRPAPAGGRRDPPVRPLGVQRRRCRAGHGLLHSRRVSTLPAPVHAFQQMLVENGVMLRNYWCSVSGKEQEKRFRSRLTDPMRRWSFRPPIWITDPLGGPQPGPRTRCSHAPIFQETSGAWSRPKTRRARASTYAGVLPRGRTIAGGTSSHS